MRHAFLDWDDVKHLMNQFDMVDTIEGSLVDNYMLYGNGMTIYLMEHYLNCWSSDIEVIVFSDGEDDVTFYNERWEKLRILTLLDIDDTEFRHHITFIGGNREREVVKQDRIEYTAILFDDEHRVVNVYSPALDIGFDYDFFDNRIVG